MRFWSAFAISESRSGWISVGTVNSIFSPTPSKMTPLEGSLFAMSIRSAGRRSTVSLLHGVTVLFTFGMQVTQVTFTSGTLVGLATSASNVTVSPTSASAQSTPSPLSMCAAAPRMRKLLTV